MTGNLQQGNQSWECKNPIFHLRLVESLGAKPTDMKSRLY